MKYLIYSFLVFSLLGCKKSTTITVKIDEAELKQAINKDLDAWHKAASDADFKAYFNGMTNDGVFIGTDATENWQNQDFKTFSKPYFDRGKAWSFTAIDRHVYLSENGKLAWFDELLDTQMKLCRGSGVLEFKDGMWKVKHYVLSIAIPNDNVKSVVDLKKETDSILVKTLRTR